MRILQHLVSIAAIVVLVTGGACSGEDGANGTDGADGAKGDPGAKGDLGAKGDPGEPGLACWDVDASGTCDLATEDLDGDGDCDAVDCQFAPPVSYVGSAACKTCHDAIGASFDKSGHPHKLTKVVGGVKPTMPFDSVTGGIPDPPVGLTWDDITYVIGGFGWKVRYIGSDGYIVTGTAADSTQWSFPNAALGLAGAWVPYHAGDTRAFDCGGCHTTGWIPCPVGDATCAHQDGLEGMAGSFAEPGVQCEACHGPGGDHIGNPYLIPMPINRDAEMCGSCHKRDDVESINASNGFIRHHEQWEEMFQSKKHAMRCIDCHDPHKSAKFADATVNPDKGIRIECESCHFDYGKNQASAVMQLSNQCVDCHMPRLVKSAQADAAQFSGDIRSHLFAINTDAAAPQFSGDGEEAMPYLTLEFACRNCHSDTGFATNYDDATLEAKATGYHDY